MSPRDASPKEITEAPSATPLEQALGKHLESPVARADVEVEQPAAVSGSGAPAVTSTEASTAGSARSGDFREILITSLSPGKGHRGEDKDVADLVDSFDHTPQLQPIVVRPTSEGFEIVAGHRRTDALRRMGVSHVWAQVLDVDDRTAELYGLEENLRRKALADEGAALARVKALYESWGATSRGGDRRSAEFVSNGHNGRRGRSATAKVAELVGKSERQVRREIRVAKKGVPELKQALDNGDITESEAEKISGHPPEQQRQDVAERRAEKNATDVPAGLHRVERSLAQARKQLSSFRKMKAPPFIRPSVVGRLKEMAAALVLEVTELEKATADQAAINPGDEGQP